MLVDLPAISLLLLVSIHKALASPHIKAVEIDEKHIRVLNERYWIGKRQINSSTPATLPEPTTSRPVLILEETSTSSPEREPSSSTETATGQEEDIIATTTTTEPEEE